MEGKKDINLYFKNGKLRKQPKKVKQVPISVVKEEGCYGEKVPNSEAKYGQKCARQYDPPLPVSVVKEPEPEPDKKYIPPNESTCELYNADCLEKMKDLPDKSIDLIFCDLPYNQTSCKWDIKIDLDLFWKQVMRIKKLNTPIFFTTTTKFGVDLIKSAPKKCYFRYDLVWVKSAPAGFLSAKKMPMRKHEMIYVFYEKLPLYDLSSHKHKFIDQSKNKNKLNDGIIYNGGKEMKVISDGKGKQYEPPLPVSIIKGENNTYNTEARKKPIVREKAGKYETPLPNSMLEIKSTRGKHSTEKPVALMEWIFKYYSKEGDTILDPTAGSGSTGVACKNMNRNFIGIEMDEDIFDSAKKRLNIKE